MTKVAKVNPDVIAVSKDTVRKIVSLDARGSVELQLGKFATQRSFDDRRDAVLTKAKENVKRRRAHG